jgi:hypothetical protein
MVSSLRLFALPVLSLALLAGCSLIGGNRNPCKDGNADYLAAIERPRLQLPEGVSGSERLGGGVLAIPTADPNPDKLDPAPACLDQPPGFFRRAGGVADAAEDAVNAWANAWANRKANQVAAFYSPNFQAEGGSAAFIDQRRQQVESGTAPKAELEETTLSVTAPDRRVITFVQRFGENAVRKELTLVREAPGWRIVSERTIEVL